MTTVKPKVGTGALMALLRKHYLKSDGANQDWNGGIYVEEVGINGGPMVSEQGYTSRRCDAIFAGFTSASGRLLVGHEVKTSRSDWLSELKKIGKADFWHDNTHKWLLVVDDPAIVKDGELPEGWGLMAPRGSGIATLVAPVYRPVTPSWTAVRSIMSRFDTERVALIAKALDKERIRRDAEMAKYREQFRATGHNTPQQQQVDEIIRLAKAAMGEDGRFITLDSQIVADAIADAQAVKDAANHARAQLVQQIRAGQREAQQLSTLLTRSYGPLGTLLKDMGGE